jgi:hypothetical protein
MGGVVESRKSTVESVEVEEHWGARWKPQNKVTCFVSRVLREYFRV